ncbi:MAG: PHP domain-containing protein [Salinarchaeum sp.]
MPVADLHVHTTRSDGQLSPTAVPAVAADAGLDAVALTDHDRVHADLDGPLVEQAGVTVISGIELRVETDTGARVDLLGYGVTPTDALRRECERLAADRRQRAAAMIDCVEDHLGITLDIEPFDGIGRPHLARAIATHPGCQHDETDAFETLIGRGDPCYRPRAVPSFERGRRLLTDACAVVGLAHPFRYDDPEMALALVNRLDAVERHYPYGRSVDTARIDRLLSTTELLPTGGSDAHDDRLGHAGMDASEYRAIRAAIERHAT